jgi:hypothetical protein
VIYPNPILSGGNGDNVFVLLFFENETFYNRTSKLNKGALSFIASKWGKTNKNLTRRNNFASCSNPRVRRLNRKFSSRKGEKFEMITLTPIECAHGTFYVDMNICDIPLGFFWEKKLSMVKIPGLFQLKCSKKARKKERKKRINLLTGYSLASSGNSWVKEAPSTL